MPKIMHPYPKMPESKDRRIKIPKSEHPIIKNLHFKQHAGIRELARRYGVDKRLIQFILFPERQTKARENRDWRHYYSKEKHRLYMQTHRAHKYALQGKEFKKWRSETRTDTKKNQLKSRKEVK